MEAKSSFDLHAEFGPEVTVQRIEVREQTLSFLRPLYGHEDMKGPRKIGKHDYIIFTAIVRNNRPFKFVAEKLRKRSLCGGMPSYVRMVPLSEYSSAALPSRPRFVWELNRWTVPTTELNTILKTTGHRYNLFTANCWSYAANTVESVLGLCLCHSLLKRDFQAVRGCMEALVQLETVKRPLPRDVLRLVFRPTLISGNRDTTRKLANWCNRRSVKLVESCARDCDTVKAVLNLCLLLSQNSGTISDTVEAVLYLCLRHSLRRHDLELARGCEEALVQLETVKRPLPSDVLRLIFRPKLICENLETLRKIGNWWNRRPVELASSCSINCDTVEAVLSLRLRRSLRMHDPDLARGCKEALQQLETVEHPEIRDVLRLVFKPLSHQNPDTWRKIGNWWSRSSHKFLVSYCSRYCVTDEARLYLFLRHSLRRHDLELARGCEEALQKLEETVKRPLPRDVFRFVYKPLSHHNPDTSRTSTSGGIVFQLKWRRPAPEIVTQMYTEPA